MKRILVILMAALLLASSAACTTATPKGADETAAAPAKTPAPTREPEQTPTPAPAPAISPLPADDTLIGKMTSYMTNTPAANLTLQDQNGKEWELSDLKGKIVLINFWATWCGPCVGEMPEFQKFFEKYGGDQYVILSVASSGLEQLDGPKTAETIKGFAADNKYTYPILIDTDGSVWEKYHQEYVPVNYILDTNGNIRMVYPGAFPDEAMLLSALEAVRRNAFGQSMPVSAPTEKPTPTPAHTAPAAIEPIGGDEAMIAEFAATLQDTAATDFALQDQNGKAWKLSDLKGKIVLLNFWATWCGPCTGEMPEFQKVYDKYGPDGQVVILSVCSSALEHQEAQMTQDVVMKFAQTQKFTYPILFDLDGTVWKAYQNDSIPASYILDTKGRIRLLKVGAMDEAHLLSALEAVRRADSGK